MGFTSRKMKGGYRYARILASRRFFWMIMVLLGMVSLMYLAIVPHTTSPLFIPSGLSQMFPALNIRNVVEKETTDPLLRAARKVRSQSGTLLVPVINDAYLPFAYNWLCHTKDTGLHDSMLIITTDDKTRDKLQHDWPEVNVVSMNINNLGGDRQYGQAGFVKVNAKRHEYLYRLLKEGYDILHFDFDQVWLMNPVPLLKGHAYFSYDFLVMRVSTQLKEYCSGFVYIFNTRRSVQLWHILSQRLSDYASRIDSMKDQQAAPFYMIDQNAWTQLIRNKTVEGLSFRLLPLEDFADGKWYEKSKQEQQASTPFVIHNNFIKGNKAKKARAKKFNHWFLNDNMTCNMDLVHKIVTRNS